MPRRAWSMRGWCFSAGAEHESPSSGGTAERAGAGRPRPLSRQRVTGVARWSADVCRAVQRCISKASSWERTYSVRNGRVVEYFDAFIERPG